MLRTVTRFADNTIHFPLLVSISHTTSWESLDVAKFLRRFYLLVTLSYLAEKCYVTVTVRTSFSNSFMDEFPPSSMHPFSVVSDML